MTRVDAGPVVGVNGSSGGGGGAVGERGGDDASALASAVDRARELMAPLDEDIRRRAEDLVSARDAFLAAGVREMVRRLKADDRSRDVLFELVDDPLVYAVLMELGVVRADVMTRAARAMERIKPYVRGHGGDIELVRVEDTAEGRTAFVRLHGACSGCSMSAETLRDGVEEAIRAGVPEIVRVEEVKDGPVAGVVALTVGASDVEVDAAHGWVEGPEAAGVVEGEAVRVRGEGYDVVVVRREDRLFAYRNACPHRGMPLHDGELEGDVLTCAWHGYRFDVTSGECENVPQVQLEPFPLRVRDGRVWVRPEVGAVSGGGGCGDGCGCGGGGGL